MNIFIVSCGGEMYFFQDGSFEVVKASSSKESMISSSPKVSYSFSNGIEDLCSKNYNGYVS